MMVVHLVVVVTLMRVPSSNQGPLGFFPFIGSPNSPPIGKRFSLFRPLDLRHLNQGLYGFKLDFRNFRKYGFYYLIPEDDVCYDIDRDFTSKFGLSLQVPFDFDPDIYNFNFDLSIDGYDVTTHLNSYEISKVIKFILDYRANFNLNNYIYDAKRNVYRSKDFKVVLNFGSRGPSISFGATMFVLSLLTLGAFNYFTIESLKVWISSEVLKNFREFNIIRNFKLNLAWINIPEFRPIFRLLPGRGKSKSP
jgi:hypothetical protein